MALRRAVAADRFAFGPGVVLEVRGDRATRSHFRREYGPARGDHPGEIQCEADFGGRALEGGRAALRGGHKSVGWTVSLSEPDARPLTAAVSLRGRPRRFARSLVQGYFVEPLLAVAAVRRDCVLLPAAALVENDGAVVLLGRSGVGKSTLCARAAASGWRMFGDDQVIVGGSGHCWPFPRRLRMYPDLRETAPLAYEQLGAQDRASLSLRRIVQRATCGYVAPSLAVAQAQLGAPQDRELPIRRVLVIERGSRSRELESERLAGASSLIAAQDVIASQRRHLSPAGGSWGAELEQTQRRELAILERAFAGAAVERIGVPGHWEPSRAAEALWQRLTAGTGERL